MRKVVIARDGKAIVRLVPDASPRVGRARHFDWAGEVYGPLNEGWDASMTDEEIAEFEDGPIFPKESAQ